MSSVSSGDTSRTNPSDAASLPPDVGQRASNFKVWLKSAHDLRADFRRLQSVMPNVFARTREEWVIEADPADWELDWINRDRASGRLPFRKPEYVSWGLGALREPSPAVPRIVRGVAIASQSRPDDSFESVLSNSSRLIKRLTGTETAKRLWQAMHGDARLPNVGRDPGPDLWILAVFELACQQVPGSPLEATRLRRISPDDAFAVTSIQADEFQEVSERLLAKGKTLAWFAELEDFCRASSQAMDILIEWVADELTCANRVADSAELQQRGLNDRPCLPTKDSVRETDRENASQLDDVDETATKGFAVLKSNCLLLAKKFLKGAGLRIVELVCESDTDVPIPTLAADPNIAWKQPFDGAWSGAQSRINKVLRDAGAMLRRHDNCARIVSVDRKSATVARRKVSRSIRARKTT